MTAQSIMPGPSVAAVNWTMIGVAVAFLVQFAGGVSFAAKAQAEIVELKETTQPLRTGRGALVNRIDKLEESTKPLRDGDLVRIQTDVAWIRERLSKDERR